MDKSPIHILHLDDDPVDAEIVRHHVDSKSYKVTWVDNEEDFKEALVNESIDLVLSDYNMPDYSAMEALKEVRKYFKYMPFLVISGAIGDKRAAEIIRGGVDDYVLKDNLPRIQVAIENVLVKKNDKEKIHELESMYETMVSTTNAVFMRWNTDGQCVFVNERFRDIFEMTVDDVINQSWQENILEGNKPIFYDALNAAIQQKRSGSFELKVVVGQKRIIKWFSVYMQPEIDANNEMVGVTGTIFDITDIKETTYKASYDELTGLANRYLLNDFFDKVLSRARRKSTSFALVLFDIDYFKQINDKYGHPVGDKLLLQMANRLQNYFRKEDMVSRIGGDEFAIIIEDIKKIKNLEIILKKLRLKLEKPYLINDVDLNTTLSIGVSIYSKDNDVDKEILVEQADNALYQAKEEGRNRTRYYSIL